MDEGAIQDEALHFIEQRDDAANETFTRGDSTAEGYRATVAHIGIIQRLMVEILYGQVPKGYKR